jgi:UDP-2-acetamido-3-amino-2,3-dideoxy-glucuronate N-acetyltransferase
VDKGIIDVSKTILEFGSGVTVHLFAIRLHPYNEQKLMIVGDRMMAVFNDLDKDNKLTVYPHRIDWLDGQHAPRKAEGKETPLPAIEPLRLECAHFLDCVVEQKVPRADSEESLRMLLVLQACEESLRAKGAGEGRRGVKVPLLASDAGDRRTVRDRRSHKEVTLHANHGGVQHRQKL